MATTRSTHQRAQFYMLCGEMATGTGEEIKGGVAKQSLRALDQIALGRKLRGRQMANPKGVVS